LMSLFVTLERSSWFRFGAMIGALPPHPPSPNCVALKIDKDYRTYERVIREMKAKEDKMAVTFVDKVNTSVMTSETAASEEGSGPVVFHVRAVPRLE